MDGQVILGREVAVVFAEENRKKPSEMRSRDRIRFVVPSSLAQMHKLAALFTYLLAQSAVAAEVVPMTKGTLGHRDTLLLQGAARLTAARATQGIYAHTLFLSSCFSLPASNYCCISQWHAWKHVCLGRSPSPRYARRRMRERSYSPVESRSRSRSPVEEGYGGGSTRRERSLSVSEWGLERYR